MKQRTISKIIQTRITGKTFCGTVHEANGKGMLLHTAGNSTDSIYRC